METVLTILITAFYTAVAIRAIVVTYRANSELFMSILIGLCWPATGFILGVGTMMGMGSSIYDDERHARDAARHAHTEAATRTGE